MPLSKDEIIKLINVDEPDYPEIVSKLSAEDVPILIELSTDANPAIATKAISCLGLMRSERSLAGLQQVVNSPDPVKRIAAANALSNMMSVQGSAQLVDKLLDDNDIGVRKFALKTVETGRVSQLKEKVRLMNQKEQNPALKELSGKIWQKL